MSLDLTFKQVCEFIKEDQPELIESVDKLLGITIILSPIVLGPAAAGILPLLTAKNELTKIGKGIFEKFTKKRAEDYLARQSRMQVAYGLITYTAFFAALDRLLPKDKREKFSLQEGEKSPLIKSAQSRASCLSDDSIVDYASNENRFLVETIPFPHPAEDMSHQLARQLNLYQEMAKGFLRFIQGLAAWEELAEIDKKAVSSVVEKLPKAAVETFEAQYFELSRRFEDFAVWANLHEHKKTKELIGKLSDYVRQHAALTRVTSTNIDIGFGKLHKAVLSMPEALDLSQAENIVDGLTLHYRARINEPIIEDKEEIQEDKPRLSFPRVRDAFVPQSFRVLRQAVRARRLEDEATWTELPRRDDLGAFLLSYLSSPYSTEAPLLILGHPGSGKSLLTTVLSAQLMSKHYTAIRVPLREVNSDASIVSQIEEQIARITSVRLDPWSKISGAFKNNPPLVILDGYDELLQASGKVFSTYLQDVQSFQRNETEQGRPVRVIVTSRVTLIDKATIPLGSTIVRLLEFDERQRNRWISIWNASNASYFAATKHQSFELPSENEADSTKILALAEQPLLLLMLALYDSEGNKLRNSRSLDRTVLYESLLRRFVLRERGKDRKFQELGAADKKRELDFDMHRLGVAAIGMYNRRKLHILSSELNDDLKFFNAERDFAVTSGRPLTQADLLLGSFFFVHKSRAQQTAGTVDYHEEIAAFEFLHNTFGEFLTADFIMRQTLVEVEALKALSQTEVLRAQLEQKLGAADGFSRSWFASLVYTPLFTRPVVLEMMREWISHLLRRRQLSRSDFLTHLDTIIINQMRRLLSKREMPSIMRKEAAQEGYVAPFGDHPLLGHMAIYSLNLILLRAIVSNAAFVFDEQMIESHEDGARPWEKLTHIWRSWFAMDNLNGITAVITTSRDKLKVSVGPKESVRVSESRSRLETFQNVSIALGDDISACLAGLLLYDPTRENRLDLEEIERRLTAEDIGVEASVAIKRIQKFRYEPEEFTVAVRKAVAIFLRAGSWRELEIVIMYLRLFLEDFSTSLSGSRRTSSSLLQQIFDPRVGLMLAERAPASAVRLLDIIEEFGEGDWSWHMRRELTERMLHSSYIYELSRQFPDRGAAFIRFVRRLGEGRGWAPRFASSVLDSMHTSDLINFATEKPELGVELLLLARDSGHWSWLEQIGREMLYRIDPSYLPVLLDTNPKLFLELMSLMRHYGGRQERLGLETLFRHLFDSSLILDLAGRDPDVASALIEVLGESFPSTQSALEISERFMRPRFVIELAGQNPVVALAWLRLVQQVGSERSMRLVVEEVLGRYLDPRSVYDMSRQNFGVIVALGRMTQEFGTEKSVKKFEQTLLPRILDSNSLLNWIQGNPSMLLEVLRLVRNMSPEAAPAFRQSVDYMVNVLKNKQKLKSLPLEALEEVRWLAQVGKDQEFSALVEDISR